MFGRRKKSSPEPKKETTSLPKGVVIRSMPKEFRGVYGDEPQKQQPKPVPTPVPEPPKPVAVPQPKPVIKKPRKRSRLWLFVSLFLFLLMVGLGVAVYMYLGTLEPDPEPDQTIEQPTNPDQTTQPETQEPVPGIDTDSDGLSNVEEALYGTDYRNPDSDGDTFLDGNEVFHRFDPLGLAPSTLLQTGAVETIQVPSETDTYELLYPKAWNAVTTRSGITFQPRTASRILVTWSAITEGETFTDWYQAAGATDTFGQLIPGTTKNGYTMYQSPDKRTVYVMVQGGVVTFRYDLRTEERIEYLQTFQMMVNSFIVQ